jgi:hypothetical protein
MRAAMIWILGGLLLLVMVPIYAQDSTKHSQLASRLAAFQLKQLRQNIPSLSPEQHSSLGTTYRRFQKALNRVLQLPETWARRSAFQRADRLKHKAICNILNGQQRSIYKKLQQRWSNRLHSRSFQNYQLTKQQS